MAQKFLNGIVSEGNITTDSKVIAGSGDGSVALTVNDGGGNANLTFNHADETPDKSGNSFRIRANVDSSSSPAMLFEMASGVTADTSVSTSERFRIDNSGVKVRVSSGGIMDLQRDDTSVVGNNVLGKLRFMADDPTNGSFNIGAEIKAKAEAAWDTDNYSSRLEFFTTTTDTSILALTIDKDQDATFAGDVVGASFAVPSGASTGFLKADGSVDSTSYSGYTFGSTDLTFSGADPGDIVWRNGDGDEVHRIWSGTNDYLTYRNDAGTTYELISAGSTSYNNTNWDAAYTHSQAAHAPTNAEQNVQSDWNATSGDAQILNKLNREFVANEWGDDRFKRTVTGTNISAGNTGDTWVKLSSVDITNSYHKVKIKFTIGSSDDNARGREQIDVLYENSNSAQENHQLSWYAGDSLPTLFKAVKSIRSASSGTSNTYDVYVQMDQDWQDNFTVHAEWWRYGGSIEYPTTEGSSTTPTAGSDDKSLTSRQRWVDADKLDGQEGTYYLDYANFTSTPTIPTDFVSAASGGTFSGDLAINADLTINGSTDSNGAVTPRTLEFTTNPTNSGLAGSNEYLIGEVAFTGKDSSANAAGKYGRIKGSVVDSGNTTVQGSAGEGGKLQFTLLKHDVGAQPRVEYDVLTLQPTIATFASDVTMSKAAPTLEISSTSGGTAAIILGRTSDTKARIKAGDALAGDLTFSTGGSRRIQIANGGGITFNNALDATSATFSGNVTASSGTGHFSVVNASGYQLNGTYIVDSSKNIVNISKIRFGSSDAVIDTGEVTSATATTIVSSVTHGTYNAAFFDFVIKNGTNVRAGTVYACHNGASTPLVEFAETSTVDLGDTSDVTLDVVISGTNMVLRATTTSSTWTIKTLIRVI